MWARALAGVVPGFVLAAALVALACWSLPGPWQATLVPGLVAFFPAWMCAIGAAFFFSSGRRAWAWLGLAAVGSLAALWTLQSLRWIA
ncbi:MAG: hypothetical protein EOP92_14515 [Lysobacteraceae bacterium]|jgi:hypothetical protein|nr:MAG: hypothetical protein EOP92_14515 [Xanthomonadaceae bacterium]